MDKELVFDYKHDCKQLGEQSTIYCEGTVYLGEQSTIYCEEFTRQTNTCSKATMETLEKGVKYAQSWRKRHLKDVIDVVLVSLWLTLNIFCTFFYCFYC